MPTTCNSCWEPIMKSSTSFNHDAVLVGWCILINTWWLVAICAIITIKAATKFKLFFSFRSRVLNAGDLGIHAKAGIVLQKHQAGKKSEADWRDSQSIIAKSARATRRGCEKAHLVGSDSFLFFARFRQPSVTSLSLAFELGHPYPILAHYRCILHLLCNLRKPCRAMNAFIRMSKTRPLLQANMRLNFSTTPTKNIPPILVALIKPASRIFAAVLGRRFRLWWKKLPEQEKHLIRQKTNKNGRFIGG